MSRLGLDLSEEKRALLERLLAEEGLDEAPAERIPRRAGGAPAPLSFAQERLWFLDSLEPGSTAYNMPFALALDGALDVGALRRALAGIVRRHEVLRTTFAERERRPVQVVSAAAETPLPRVDLAGVAAGERVCRALLKAAAARPFDLARGPLVRALLVRLGARRHVLLLDLHHIVADGASVGILVAETSALYAAGSAGRRSPLQAPPVQYADYAVWQRGALEGEPAERLIEWWRELLADVPPVLELPFDRPRPRERSGRGGRCRIAFGPDVTEALRSLGRAHRSSLFMTLLAGFGALLGRLSLQRRVVVGAPVENRDRAELRDLIGFFTNTLPLPVDLGASPSFERLLARVRETALGGFAHQELPFARMVEALRPERSLGHSPLFQVIFALQPAAEALRHALPGLVLEPLETDLGSAKFDLSLLLVESAGGLAGSFEYDRDLFDATTVERWASHLRALLAAAVARPGAPLEALPLLGAAESHQLALEWNDAPRPGPSALVHRRIAAVAAGRPDAVAVRRGREHLSYGALAEGARRWATRLRRSGVGPGVPVGVLMERRPALVSALLGVLEAGGSYLPLDPAYPVESLRFRLEDSGTRVVIADRASRPVVPGVDGLELLLSDPAAGAAAHTADEGADDEASEAREAREARTAGPPAAVFPEEVAYTIYTSGSTGRPKGVQITHGGFAERVRWGCGAFSGSELAGVLAATSITFDLSVFELFVPLAAGGGVVLAADALDLVDGGVADLDRGMRVTLVNTVPSVLAEVLRAGPLPGSVRTVNLAGETWPAQLAGALRPTVERLLNLYGPSEDTTYSTLHAVPAGADGAPPIGRPLPGTRAWVVDPDLRDVPIGVAGELCLGGGGLARSYARRPAWTAERFVPDPFGADPGARLYRTGDRARRDASGELDFLGRLDHQVKVRGYRIEPGEIEAALGHHPGIDRVVVAAHDQGGQGGQGTGDARLVAYVVAGEAAEPPGLGEMRRFLADTLPAHMLPSAVVVLSELPLTATGKVDRRRLPAPGSAASSPARRIAPRGPVEEAVAEVWREVLGVADAGAGDDFFDVGGHSLAAASVVSRLCGLFGVELPVRALFESPVLSDLAVRIASLRAGGTAAAGPPLERRTSLGEPAPLSFAQERLWFLHRLDPASPAYNLAAAVRLSGALDPARLERALATVEGRHAVLRSVLVEGPDGPVQVVRERPPLPLARVDLFRLGAPREVARRLVRRLARRPFDLASGPPWRATLIRLDAAEHLLLVEMHHAVSDGWSLGVLVRELAAFYQGVELEPPPVTYADFATWQRERLDGGRRERLLDAWRRRLADDPAALDLGADRPRPGFEGHRAGRVGLRVDAATTSALRALARDGGATLFIALLGAFQTLLGRRAGAWSGGPRRIPVGTPVAGRDRTEVEGLIGLFVNTLVLSTDVGGDPSFREVLARARETALDAYEHQDLPFAALVEALRPERSLGRTPLFQALLVLQNAPIPTPTLRLPGLELATEEVEPAAAKVDLALALREEGEGLAGTLEFSRELFDFTTVLRLRGHFLRLLAAITAAPDAPVAELPLLAAAERHQLVREWQGAPLAHGPELLHELVAAQARRTPDAIALEAGGERLSYRHLHRRAKALARRLRAAGVAPESVVGVCLGRGAGLVTALLGVLEAGGAYLPVDPAYPRERIAFLLGDAQRGGAGVVVTEEALRPLLAGYPGEVLTVGRDSPGAPTEAPPDRAAARPSAPASLAYVIYTSGSTGTPKGVALGHGGAVALVRWAAGVFPPEDLRAVLATTSVSFDLSVFEIFVPLALGGRVVLLDDALALVASPERAAAGTLLDTVPSALAEVLRAGALPPGLRTVDLAGEALGRGLVRALAEAAPDLRVLNLYGPSEDTTYSTWAELAPPEPGRPADPEIGRPVAGTRAHPLDGRLRPVPGGVTGDLYVAGAGLARGYLGRPATTAAAFLPDPFAEAPGGRLYRTGDRVRQRSDGTLDFLGRADHQVKLHGFRIELGEIEAALLGDPRVTGAAVLVRGDSLAAWVEPADLDAAALVEELRAVLPAYMVPATLEALVALPRTPNGKVDRAALARRAPARAPSPGGTPPGSSEERLLAAVWREVLGGGTPAVEDDFFAAGGHSLLAVRLVARLRARGVELPLRAVFEAPTLGELARRLVAGAGPSAVLAPAAGPDGTPDPRLSANQERLWFLDRLEPGAAAFNLPLALELDGGLDAGALGRAVAGIVRRHATLRSTFPEADGVPVRRVHPLGARVPMPVVDLSGLPAAAREAEALRRVRAASLHGFDLAVEPGFRSLLVRLADRRHAFVATLHHLVADGWSLGVFRAELAVLYARRSGSREAPAPPPLPRLPIAFSDYAAWERTGLESPEAEADLDARVERLHGAPGRLALPTDRPRPAAQGFARERLARSLPPGRVAELEALGRERGATLFMVLLSAFELVLARWAGERDFLIGTPVAHRDRVELEPLIGLLVNTLVLRATVPEGTFADHLARQRGEVLDAFARPELPFARLVERLRPERGLDRAPLVQVMFNLLRFPDDAFEARPAGLVMRALPLGTPRTDLDLLLTAVPTGDGGIALDLIYDPALFDRATVEELLAQLAEVLTQVAPDAGLPLDRISLVTPAARRWLPDTGRPLAPAGPAPPTITARLAEHARAAPERTAVLSPAGALSYGALAAEAAALAHRLRSAGVARGDRVAVRAARSPELVCALAGVLHAGAAFVVIDPAHPPARQLEVVRASRPRAWIDLAPEPPAGELAELLETASLADLACRLSGPRSWGVGGGSALEPVDPIDPMGPAEVGPEDLAYVAFTSGSTGRPKGIAGAHGPLSRFFDGYARAFAIGPGDRVSLLSGLAHDPLLRDLFAPLWAGAAVVVPAPADLGVEATPGALDRFLRRRNVTVTHLTPATARLLDPAGGPLPALRLVVFGGDRLLGADVERVRALAPGVTVVNGYGTTETPQLAAWEVLAPGAPARAGAGATVPVGGGVDGAQLWVVPLLASARGLAGARSLAGARGLAGVGELGEIRVRSRSLARGYLEAAATAERFLPAPAAGPGGAGDGDRVYRTGDLGRYLPGGRVRYHGRGDRQLSVRGFRVEPAEVELHLEAHPDVSAAAVTARPGPDGEPVLAAFVVPRPERAPSLGGRPRRRLDNGLAVVELHRGETDYLYREIFELQAYLRHGLEIRDGDVVLDVGANIGLFLLFAHRVAAAPRVYCFEPNPEVREVLEHNARLYGGDARIFGHGLAEAERGAEFTFFEGMSLLSGLYADEGTERELVRSFLAERAARGEGDYGDVLRHADDLLAERLRTRRFEVRLRPLSAVIAELGLERIDYLKINVEKSELDVVSGMRSEDWRRVRQVAIEIDVRDHLDPIRELLEAEGFETAVVQDELLAGSELYYLYAARPGSCPGWRRAETPGSHLRALPDLAEPPPLDGAELLRHLAARLPAYLVPSTVTLVERLPLTPSGKLDVLALKAMAAMEALAQRSGPGAAAAAGRPPSSATERSLAAAWGELLGVEAVGAGTDYFAAGGHSLLATRLLARVRDSFGVELALRQLFETPTLEGFAAAIDERRGAAAVATAAALPALVPAPDERHEPFPLTPIQQAYWVGRGGAFELGNVSTHLYMEIEGPSGELGVARFERAWQRLIDRHEMLRAVVDADGRQRIVADPPPYRIAVDDLRDLAPEAVRERLAERRRTMSHQVLAADRWPLFELRASDLPGGRTRLHVSFDFLIADAWSIRILLGELYLLHERPEAELPAIDCSFRDYVLAEARLVGSEPHLRSVEYWSRRAAALPPGPALPVARTSPALARPRFVRRQASLPPAAWRRLQERARSAGLTPSGVLLAAFAETLAAWSESPHFTLTLTLFHRLPLHPRVDRLVGDFTSVVLLEVTPPAGAAEPFSERAGRWQRQLWDDLDHRYVSGVDVVRRVARQKGGMAGTVAPVVFTSTLGLADGAENAGNAAGAAGAASPEAPRGDAPGEVVYSITQTPQVLLDHQVMEHGGALLYNWDALDALFPEGLLDEVFASYGRLLERLTGEAEAWDEPAPLSPPDALGAMVAAANATAVAMPETVHLHRLVIEQAARTPASPAVISFAGRQRVELSYGELVRRAASLATELRRRGVRPNELVAVVAEKGWEQVVAVLAVQIAGAAYLPIDPGQPGARRALLLDQGRVRVALTPPRLDAGLAWPAGVERLVVKPEAAVEEPPDGLLEPAQEPTDLAYVIFTSGSSGTPKGVMIEHRSAVNTVVDVNRRLGLGPSDRVLGLSALNFDLSVWDIFGPLAVGGALVLPEPEAGRDPARWSELMAAEGVTVWNSVPTLMSMWVDFQDQREALPEPVGGGRPPGRGPRAVMMSGDWIPVDLPDRIRRLVPSAAVYSLGGATEASIWSILYPVGEVGEGWQSIPYGRPMDNQAFHVLGDGFAPRPVWVPGELYIGGVGVARGYWRDDERTAASFVRHPATGERLYRTGDLGRWLPDGNIELLGRRDFQVKVQGHRIELGEIEATLARQPGVRAVVVDAVGERMRSKTLVAFVVPEGRGGDVGPPARPDAGSRSVAEPPPLSPPLPAGRRPLDAAERLQHKLSQPGLRRDLLAAGAEAVTLAERPLGEPERRRHLARRSERSFLPGAVPLTELADLLAALHQLGAVDRPLPKYRYPSAGSLYPVQTYLDVRPGRVAGLAGGLYYHDPREHRLLQVSPRPTVDPGVHAEVNRELFEGAAFAIYLVADLDAIEPHYGDAARDFSLIEAGAVCQLLMERAAGRGVGLCPVGGVAFDAVRARLGLGERHAYLIGLLGGAVEVVPVGAPATEPPADADAAWVETLRAALERSLPEYMVPGHFVLLPALPLSANGKVDRGALPVPSGLAGGPSAPYVAPRDELEGTIAAAWERVLERERVGVEDNFFDLGGTSVEIIRLHGELVRATGREISLVELFDFSTVGSMARYLSRDPGADGDDALASSRERARERRRRRRGDRS